MEAVRIALLLVAAGAAVLVMLLPGLREAASALSLFADASGLDGGAALILRAIPEVPHLVALVCVLMTCLPSASLSVVFAQQYDCEPEYASRAVVQGMLLMIVTIPLFATLAVTLFPL